MVDKECPPYLAYVCDTSADIPPLASVREFMDMFFFLFKGSSSIIFLIFIWV